MIEVKNVPVDAELDDGGVRFRIGLIALGTSETTERDFRRLLPDDTVSFHTTRIRDVNPVTVQSLRSMGPDLEKAARDLLPGVRLDAIAYDCTTGTIALGADTVRAQIQNGRPGIPVATPATGALAGLAAVGARRLAILIPNVTPVAQMLADYFVHAGFDVKNVHNFNIESDIDMARIPLAAIMHAARNVCTEGCDGLFISCTALRTVEIIDVLEEELGIPVICSNQCMFWEALRAAGITTRITGYGRLLREN